MKIWEVTPEIFENNNDEVVVIKDLEFDWNAPEIINRRKEYFAELKERGLVPKDAPFPNVVNNKIQK